MGSGLNEMKPGWEVKILDWKGQIAVGTPKSGRQGALAWPQGAGPPLLWGPYPREGLGMYV